MITIHDLVEAYNRRYYGSDGLNIFRATNTNADKKISEKGIVLAFHDCCHVLASGAANLNLEENVDAASYLKFLDDNGLVDRNVGIKAELLQEIYRRVSLWSESPTLPEIKEDFNHNLVPEFKAYLEQHPSGRLSHIPALHTLLDGYRDKIDSTDFFEKIISADEIRFHIQKAAELGAHLRSKHPECFNGKKPIFEKILSLDAKEIAIDNFFNMREKIALRGANLNPQTQSFRSL